MDTALDPGSLFILVWKRLCYFVVYGDQEGPTAHLLKDLVRKHCPDGTVMALMGSCLGRSLYGVVHPNEDVDICSVALSFPPLVNPIYPRQDESVYLSLTATLTWFMEGVVQPSLLEILTTNRLDSSSALDPSPDQFLLVAPEDCDLLEGEGLGSG